MKHERHLVNKFHKVLIKIAWFGDWGAAVECSTWDQEVEGFEPHRRLSLSKTLESLLSTDSAKETFQHDCKIVDWDAKKELNDLTKGNNSWKRRDMDHYEVYY